MVLGIYTYDMITYFTRVNLHILFFSILVGSSIPSVNIIDFSRRNETLIIDDTSLVSPNNFESTVIIDKLNKFSQNSKHINLSFGKLKQI